MVMSATYQQSSTPRAVTKEQDFTNELYSRYPAHRLSAEFVRDNALASSGLLVRKIGGRSVFPYQPAGIWEALATRNASNYVQNHGDSLYRRSLYTIWKRSSPPPSMMNFDATDRSVCIVRRQKTASPLQALVLMNDPQFVEAARILAEKTLVESCRLTVDRSGKQLSTVNYQLSTIFQALIGRKPRQTELKEIHQLFDKVLTYFKQNPKKSKQLLSVGEFPRLPDLDESEMAAYTIVASTIMNFDEFTMEL